ncbi:LysM peptidoglycan-binding domain-containing protein [Rugamonas sp.]|uniref:LysM peptidoglycan-binding domain-containing protein n=1 Tax=Rugamonas sp. TaxID=1926287 RepID=UPI0025D560A4|nr:LysM peptidoglycan-binding domain-containing protein [Rugamonas sp.]
MKNFSTVGARLVVAALFSGVTAVSAQTLHCTFRADAPDQHLVVKGDTLWDISGHFLDKPWCWPQVWGMNREEIHNPHWIYPGQIVYFDRVGGRLRLGAPIGANGDGGGGDPSQLRLTPQLRMEGLGKDAVQSIPSGVIEPFLTQPLIVEDDELKNAPRVVATQEGHVFLGKDDKAYVRGELNGGTSFQVFRPGVPLKDPVTGKVIGHEAFYLGTLKLQTAAKGGSGSDVHTFTVANAKEEMGVGDQLMQAPPTPMRNYVPHPPEQLVESRVVAIYGGVTHAGQNQVVSINRGKLDGLDVGSVLQLYHAGRVVTDTTASKGWTGMGSPKVKLPDEEVGSLFVFRVFKHIAYGLIMQVTEPVVVGDVARSPE